MTMKRNLLIKMYDKLSYSKNAQKAAFNIFARTTSFLLLFKKHCILKTVASFSLATFITALGCFFACDLKYLQPENVLFPVVAALPAIAAGAANLDRAIKFNKMANEVFTDTPDTLDANINSSDAYISTGALIADSYFAIEKELEERKNPKYKGVSEPDFIQIQDKKHDEFCSDITYELWPLKDDETRSR